ncbi:SEC4 [Cyberlindnera jadinii]|uniref:Ras-related protein SEC4 n=1 Tax=Cyberlindnera jadinii (strain ATCC 18201 / CBS 1600 / BCRC 20928 / JCM 3617 / NBRC 0987 / NRRL Y-1542) TaxID=983966 RepID=A0A0H5C956_CYBJN|nr:ras-domain-containing protein [Cyberlindnera jadinii NRRL Y-1542]ODV70699.1 ras-domain-containing protein [Cyberlindnera jadinii NRRL Y-1542]CEP24813.1 SEC4 [Cyberlindnera jadinii]
MSGRTSTRAYDSVYKLLLIGDSGVGKSCILLRFVEDKFSPSFITTIGIDFKIRTVEVDGAKIKLQVWDTAGQERFRTITTAYYRGAAGIIIVYDVTDERTFENVKNWYEAINQHATEDAQVFLVGNKNDNADLRAVSYEQGEALARELGVPFLETSAKTNENVEELFIKLTKIIHDKAGSKANADKDHGVKVGGHGDKTSSNCC